MFPAIANLAYDTAIFFCISYRIATNHETTPDGKPLGTISWGNIISGRALPRLSRAVLKGGQQYYLCVRSFVYSPTPALTIVGFLHYHRVVVVFNLILLTLILTPQVPPQLKLVPSVPTILIISTMACRVYRTLKIEGLMNLVWHTFQDETGFETTSGGERAVVSTRPEVRGPEGPDSLGPAIHTGHEALQV